MTKNKRIILTILGLIGISLALELCVVYYNANFAIDAKPSICAINDSMNCDSVARTTYSQFFGVPLSLWGVLLYLFFLFMTYVDKLQNLKFFGFFKVFKNPLSYIFTISSLSFVISMLLGCISVFKIGSICVFCFMTYFVNLLIAIFSKTKENTFIGEYKTTAGDFFEALKSPLYLILFIISVAIFSGILTYTSVSDILAPQIAKQKEILKYNAVYKNISEGTRAGAKDAGVVINEYMDFNCGGCFIAHLYIHRILDEFENVAVIQHNLPLDISCNPNMKHPGHKNSCLKSYYALAAAKQNKYWELSNLLFNDDIKSERDIIDAAKMLNIDVKRLKADAKSDEIKKEIENSIADADSKGVQSTPTLYVGMRKLVGIGSYPDFRQIIIEQGGKEKGGQQ